MTMATFTDIQRTAGRGGREGVEEHSLRPVLGWAAVGFLFVCVHAYTMGGWALSGDMHMAGTGPTHVPLYMVVYARFQEIFYGSLVVVFLYRVLIRPWRREGHVTQDGLFLL